MPFVWAGYLEHVGKRHYGTFFGSKEVTNLVIAGGTVTLAEIMKALVLGLEPL